MQNSLRALAVAAATMCVDMVIASPGSCTVQEGVSCASPAQLKVATALAAEQPSPTVNLLQRNAARAGHGDEGSGTLDTVLHAGHVESSVGALGAHTALTTNVNITANVSLTGNASLVEDRENSSVCSAYTGMMCFLTDCEATLSAQCDDVTKFCKCPSYTCFQDGKCQLSPTEIANAMKNGVQGVGDTVTSIASKVPGIADSVGGLFGAASGIADTVGGIFGDWLGSNKDKCSGRYISTCFWSDCDESLGFTASCVYGSCQCKEGFCAVNDMCMVDLGALFSS